MPTTVSKTIGTTGDYSTLQSWEDAAPANLVTSDQVWEGVVLKEGGGTNNEWVTTTTMAIGGSTSDSTRFKRLKASPSAAWYANGTPVGRYDTAKGVAIRASGSYSNGRIITASESYVQIQGLMLKSRGINACVVGSGGSTTGIKIVDCIGQAEAFSSSTSVFSAGGSTGMVVTNSLLIHRNATYGEANDAINMVNCTCISDGSGTAIGGGYSSQYTALNCAFFGFAAHGALKSTSSYNATDLASITGTNSLTSLTASSQFVNATTGSSLDMRLKSGSSLIDAGTATGAPALDAFGTTRSTVDIGFHEYVAAGSSFIAKGLKPVQQAIGGMY